MAEPVFRVTILTEEGRQYENDAISIVAPGELGLLGILAHHAPLLTTLTPGLLTVRTPAGAVERFLVGHGLLEVLRNQLTIVTDRWAQEAA